METKNNWGSPSKTKTLHWAHLTLVFAYHQTEMRKNVLTGEEYVSDSGDGRVIWKLRCDCGHTFEIAKDSFPGRRVMKNCGRAECPHAAHKPRRMPFGRAVAKDGYIYSVYMDRQVAQFVKDHASRRRMSFSAAAVQLILDGLKDAAVADQP